MARFSQAHNPDGGVPPARRVRNPDGGLPVAALYAVDGQGRVLAIGGPPQPGEFALLAPGAIVVDAATGDEYVNGGTAAAPMWSASPSGPPVIFREDFGGDLGQWDETSGGTVAGGHYQGTSGTSLQTFITVPPEVRTVSLRFRLYAGPVFTAASSGPPTYRRFMRGQVAQSGDTYTIQLNNSPGVFGPQIPLAVPAWIEYVWRAFDEAGELDGQQHLYVDGTEVSSVQFPDFDPEADPVDLPRQIYLAADGAWEIGSLTVGDSYQGV